MFVQQVTSPSSSPPAPLPCPLSMKRKQCPWDNPDLEDSASSLLNFVLNLLIGKVKLNFCGIQFAEEL